MGWFTVTEIDEDTFAISEYGHWEEVHSYLVIGEQKALLIDTGLGIDNIKREVETLTDLPVTVVTTHVHWDHIGGHNHFDDIWVHEGDEEWLENGIPIPTSAIKNNVIRDVEAGILPEGFDIEEYQVFRGLASKVLIDNDIIDIGSRILCVLHTPGHSPGHICLYEEERGYLFTGDLIYSGTLFAFYPSTDPVKYKESIDRISEIAEIKKVLPGHHELDISKDIIQRVKMAFDEISSKGLLHHGGGEFEYDGFAIKI